MSRYQVMLAIMVAISFGVIAAYYRLSWLQNIRWRTWFWWFMIGSILDWTMTTLHYLALESNTHVEENPLARYLFEQYGFGTGLAIHGIAVTTFMLAIGILLGKRYAPARLAILIGTVFRFCAVTANIFLLFL